MHFRFHSNVSHFEQSGRKGKNVSPSVERKIICWGKNFYLLSSPALRSSPSIGRKNNYCINTFHTQGGVGVRKSIRPQTSAFQHQYMPHNLSCGDARYGGVAYLENHLTRSEAQKNDVKLWWWWWWWWWWQKGHNIVVLTVIYQAYELATCIIANWTKINNRPIFVNWKAIDGELH
jgi:hypothetical protein